MALKKPTTTAAPATNTAFESEPDNSGAAQETAVAEREAAAPAPKPEPIPAAAPATASVVIAKASASALATTEAAKNFKAEVEAMFGAADFSYGSHRVFKAKDGVIKETSGEKEVLGKWVKGRLLAWDRHFEISPGEDGKTSGDFVAYSKDGVTIDNVIGEEQKSWEGKPVEEYVDYLKTEEEFEKAGKREFVDLQVAAMGSEEVPDFSGVIQITLSSSSIPAFRKFQTDLEAVAKCVAMGLPGYKLPEDPFTIFFLREAAERGKNSWTKIKLSSSLPTKF